MKKLFYMILTLALAAGLAACGGDFTWSRQGVFTDENGNYLLISASTDEEHEGEWAVTAMIGDEAHGWFIKQDGKTLHGNLDTEYDDYEGDYIVTIAEEGEDGVSMEVEGGETYHFTMEQTPEPIGVMKINTEGLGSFAYGLVGEEVEFDDEFPTQSAVENLTEARTYVIKAKPDEGYKFVKWTKDGKDFSTEPEIEVEVDSDVEFIAVFDVAE